MGNSTLSTKRPGTSKYLAPWTAIAEESARLGLPFSGHVLLGVKIDEAATSGMKSIEHLSNYQVLQGWYDATRFVSPHLSQCSRASEAVHDFVRHAFRLLPVQPPSMVSFPEAPIAGTSSKAAGGPGSPGTKISSGRIRKPNGAGDGWVALGFTHHELFPRDFYLRCTEESWRSFRAYGKFISGASP